MLSDTHQRSEQPDCSPEQGDGIPQITTSTDSPLLRRRTSDPDEQGSNDLPHKRAKTTHEHPKSSDAGATEFEDSPALTRKDIVPSPEIESQLETLTKTHQYGRGNEKMDHIPSKVEDEQTVALPDQLAIVNKDKSEKPLEDKNAALDVLWNVRLLDKDSSFANGSYKSYWSDDKFTGWKDAPEDEDEKLALIEVFRDVRGTLPVGAPSKPSMKKNQYADEKMRVNLDSDVNIVMQSMPAMRIYSDVIRCILQHVIRYDPMHFLERRQGFIRFDYPWQFPLYHYDNIQEYIQGLLAGREKPPPELNDCEPGEIKRQTKVFLNIIRPQYEKKFKPESEIHQKNGGATFEDLWVLFKPGEPVYAKMDGELAEFIAIDIEFINRDPSLPSLRTRTGGRCWQVHLWNYRYVGGRLRRHASQIIIEPFSGQQEITKLPVFPCKYHDMRDGALRRKLVERGQKFLDILRETPAHKLYKGMTLGSNGMIAVSKSKPRMYEGQIIIDPVTYTSHNIEEAHSIVEKKNPEYDPLLPSEIVEPQDFGGGHLWKGFHNFDPKDEDITKLLQERHYTLFPRRIRGMSLAGKNWETYDVAAIDNIVWENPNTVLNRLVLDEIDKDTIRSTCRSAQSRKDFPDISADWISGKGAGQVFLFYGSPGTGKTLTVECISQFTRQPLISLTGADLDLGRGTENKLKHWFNLAILWDAHLLIDEADVFVEHRTPKDLERNAMVSVFLRTVEYFSGMLFLTTNRLGHIDTAIKSRIQVSIHFPDFDINTRKELWKKYFTKLRDEKSKAAPTGAVENCFFKHEVMKEEINGRDIRNALQHAINLIRFDKYAGSDGEGIPANARFGLEVKHLVDAIQMRTRLTNNLVKANQATNEHELAEERHERAIPSPKESS